MRFKLSASSLQFHGADKIQGAVKQVIFEILQIENLDAWRMLVQVILQQADFRLCECMAKHHYLIVASCKPAIAAFAPRAMSVAKPALCSISPRVVKSKGSRPAHSTYFML
jgi:hypothetical protein